MDRCTEGLADTSLTPDTFAALMARQQAVQAQRRELQARWELRNRTQSQLRAGTDSICAAATAAAARYEYLFARDSLQEDILGVHPGAGTWMPA